MTRKSPLSVSAEEKLIDKTMRKQQRSDLQAPDITANEVIGHKPTPHLLKFMFTERLKKYFA
jgi:hypothetical protein